MSQRSLRATCMRIARAQYGVIHRTQALRAGMSSSSIKRCLERREWIRLRPATYLLSSSPRTWVAEVTAACLAANKGGFTPTQRSPRDPPAAASYRSAGRLWDFDGVEDDLVELTVPRSMRLRWPDIIIHTRQLNPRDVAYLGPIPLTTPARTLLDLASVLSDGLLEVVVESAVRRKMISPGRLAERLPRGVPGSPRLRALLEIGAERRSTESVLEVRFERLLRGAGLPRAERQFVIRDHEGRFVARVDFAYPDRRLAIEIDGFAYHSGRRQWHSDLARQNGIVSRGWIVLRFTSEDLASRADRVVASVESILRGRGPRG